MAGRLEPLSPEEEDVMLAAAMAASLVLSAPAPSAPSAPARQRPSDTGPAMSPSRSVPEALRLGAAECSQRCGRRNCIAADGRSFDACCKSCEHLRAKGQAGHDIECDIRFNGALVSPWYWDAQGDVPFHHEVERKYVMDMGTKLLQRRLPRASVTKAVRIEDSQLWTTFARRRTELRASGRVVFGNFVPETMDSMTYSAKTTLDRSVNEVYLLHGTSEEAARNIATSNFRPSFEGCFGSGAYFADEADRSDTYARALEDGGRIMLLCRVVLGNVCRLPDGQDREAARRLEREGLFNSLLGTTQCGKEYVVWDKRQIYPEYIMYYTR